jgi:hypothetical protein
MKLSVLPAAVKVGDIYEVRASEIPTDRQIMLELASPVGVAGAPIDEDHDGNFAIAERQAAPGRYTYSFLDTREAAPLVLASIDVDVTE